MRRKLPEISGTPNFKSSPCAAESVGAAPQKSWWSLHRSEPLKGTPRQHRAAEQGLQGNSAERSLAATRA